jgi:hypothetical protein
MRPALRRQYDASSRKGRGASWRTKAGMPELAYLPNTSNAPPPGHYYPHDGTFQEASDSASFTYADAVLGTMLPGIWNALKTVTRARPASRLLLPGGITATHG